MNKQENGCLIDGNAKSRFKPAVLAQFRSSHNRSGRNPFGGQ